MNHLKSVGKSILVGGAAAGVISLIPVINLLNLVLMMWMAFGGGLCVYLLLRENKGIDVSVSDALASGALSGVLGWAIFASVSFLLVSNISPEKMGRIMEIIRLFLPSTAEDFSGLFRGGELIRLFFVVMGTASIFSVIAGALGGIISRSLFSKKREESGTK
jgi:hypothetical protein